MLRHPIGLSLHTHNNIAQSDDNHPPEHPYGAVDDRHTTGAALDQLARR